MDPYDAKPAEDYDWEPLDDSPRWVKAGKVMLAMTPIMMLVIVIGVGLLAAVLAVLAYLFLDLAGNGFGP